jgi:hypothetical protein
LRGRAFRVWCAAAGAAILAAWALPLVRVGVSGGPDDVVVPPSDVVLAAHLGSADALAVGIAGVALLAVAAAPRTVLVLVVAASLAAAVQAERTFVYVADDVACSGDAFTYAESLDECGNSIVQLGFGRARLENPAKVDYRSRPRAGAWLLALASVPLLAVAGFRALRAVIRRRALAIALYSVLCALALFVVWLHLLGTAGS